jgi:hypothetical protein
MTAVAIGAYQAKKLFFDRLLFLQSSGQAFQTDANGQNGTTISYDEPPMDAWDMCIYGGGLRFSQPQANQLDNYGTMIYEEGSFSVYFKATVRPVCSARVTDDQVVAMATQLTSLFIQKPDLGEGHSWRGIGRGQGDFQITDNETTSYLALEMKIGSMFSNLAF